MTLTRPARALELDVKSALRWWLVPGGRNFGLVVDVEDTWNNRKPAADFFYVRNCSADADAAAGRLQGRLPFSFT